MMDEPKTCCQTPNNKKTNGFFSGLLYGLLPHSFCIAFVIFSVIGATVATTIFKNFLLLPYFLEILVGLSLIFATLSAILYLRKNNSLSRRGIKNHWRYLSILYGTTLAVNLVFFLIVFPAVANFNGRRNQPEILSEKKELSSANLQVQIPCSGHASLIIDELQKNPGVAGAKFQFPNRFVVEYDSAKISLSQILSLDIFKTYPAQIVSQ